MKSEKLRGQISEAPPDRSVEGFFEPEDKEGEGFVPTTLAVYCQKLQEIKERLKNYERPIDRHVDAENVIAFLRQKSILSRAENLILNDEPSEHALMEYLAPHILNTEEIQHYVSCTIDQEETPAAVENEAGKEVLSHSELQRRSILAKLRYEVKEMRSKGIVPKKVEEKLPFNLQQKLALHIKKVEGLLKTL